MTLTVGKSLDSTIALARKRAKKERVRVTILGRRNEPILFITPRGELEEVLGAPLRVPLRAFVMEQIVREAQKKGDISEVLRESAAARLMVAWKELQKAAKQQRKRAA